MDSDVARGLKGGTRKTGLTGDLSRAPYARVWRGIRGPSLPQKKIEFGIGGGALRTAPPGSCPQCTAFGFWPVLFSERAKTGSGPF